MVRLLPVRPLYFGSGDIELRLRDDEPSRNVKRMGRKMSIANEAATKTETLREIQEPDQPKTSASEIDRLEMLAALEGPVKAVAAEVSADTGHAPAVNQS